MDSLMYSKNWRWGNKQSTLSSAVNPFASVPWVAQWKFNNNGNDSVGTNHLTNNNSATFTTGKLGGATGATQLVAASSQYWSVADNAALRTGGQSFEIAFWLYVNSFINNMAYITKGNSAGSTYEFQISNNSNTGKPIFFIKTSGGAFPSALWGSALSTATWYFIDCYCDAQALQIGIDVNNSGTPITSAITAATASTAAPLIIGAYSDPTLYTDSLIDNVCIAKSAAGGGGVLTAAQRTALYNAGVGTEAIT